MSEQNIVYIGNKPIMNYCIAIITSLQEKGDIVTVKARGRSISTAVDVVEVTKNRFLNDLSIEDIEIGTEQLESTDGRTRSVSSISITVKK